MYVNNKQLQAVRPDQYAVIAENGAIRSVHATRELARTFQRNLSYRVYDGMVGRPPYSLRIVKLTTSVEATS